MRKKFLAVSMLILVMACGCGQVKDTADKDKNAVKSEDTLIESDTDASQDLATDTSDVSGDLQAEGDEQAEAEPEFSIDIAALASENEDVFAWIRIPGTGIDYPILQSGEEDDYYETHDADRNESEDGALYIEMANMMDMCDFNTVIHGKKSHFADLYRYADPDFFSSTGTIYVFIDGNVLTYQVFAAYERDNNSLIRNYDFSYIAGCQEFLDDLYTKEVGKNVLEGWGPITPYNFLITLTTQLEENSDKQYVVVAALVDDKAGTIEREFME